MGAPTDRSRSCWTSSAGSPFHGDRSVEELRAAGGDRSRPGRSTADATVVHGQRSAGSPRTDSGVGGELASGGRSRPRGATVTRQERGFRRWSFALFTGCSDGLRIFRFPRMSGVFGLLDRKALDELNRLPEKNGSCRACARGSASTNGRSITTAAAGVRAAETKLRPPAALRMDGVFSFWYKPLRLMVLGGSLICIRDSCSPPGS